MKNPLVAVAVLALAGAACRSTAAERNVIDKTDWSYPSLVWDASRDAFHDLFDIAYVNFGLGDGLLIDAQATKILHAGFGWVDAVRFGTRPRAIGVWSQRQAEYGLSVFYWRDINRQAVFGTETLFDQSMSYKGFDMDHQHETGHWLDFSAAVHALIIGVEVDVSPKEAIDFASSAIRWVFTVVPVRSVLHVIGVHEVGFMTRDLGSDDTDAPLREAGGSAAGAIYQGETPFYERPYNPFSAQPVAPPVENK